LHKILMASGAGIFTMPGVVRAVILRIRTVAEMIEAFADEERCRRLLEALVWPNGRVCPACGYKRSIALAGCDMGRYRARPGLPMLQWRLPFSIHRNDAHAAARHQAAAEHLAQGIVADPAIGQGTVLNSSGRGTRGEPAYGWNKADLF